MKRLFTALIGGSLLLAPCALAQSLLDEDILSAQTASFKVFDADGDGKAGASEITTGAKQVFTELDANGDGAVSPDEFQNFSMGFQPLALQIMRRDEYAQARDGIFTRWDMNGDQQLAQGEVVAAILEEALAATEASLDQPGYAKIRFIAEMQAVLK